VAIVDRAVVCAAACAAAVAFAVLAASSRSADARSTFVQRHGIRAEATVEAISNRLICDPRNGLACVARGSLAVTLRPPLGGVRRAKVSYPGSTRLRARGRLTVLVDPRDPRYAELPSRPSRGAGRWIAPAAIAALFALIAGVEGRTLGRAMTGRRSVA
jgi:hypothetical protein